MGYVVNIKDTQILVTKDGDTYSDGELYYQLLINDSIVLSNTECMIVPDGTLRFLGNVTVDVAGSAFKTELRLDELDAAKDDGAQCSTMIDLNDVGTSSQHKIRAVGADGRLDCTISFTVDVVHIVTGQLVAAE